ncbi:MAG: hypothetical protein U0T82_16770 [Bacteroidales bacterium]
MKKIPSLIVLLLVCPHLLLAQRLGKSPVIRNGNGLHTITFPG